MKTRVVVLAMAFAALCPAAEVSPFYLPIRNNDLPALRKLIVDPGVAARDARGNSPLMYAAALGSLDSMRLLLDAGADPNAANKADATPLMWCAGDAAKVSLLLSKGAKVDARSKLGRTPLLIAAYNQGAIESARLLIDKGADVNARDKGGASVLALAAAGNHIELARILIDKGANVNNVDELGFTPLLNAAGDGYYNSTMVRLLLDHGAQANAKSGDTVEMVKNGAIQLGHLTPCIWPPSPITIPPKLCSRRAPTSTPKMFAAQRPWSLPLPPIAPIRKSSSCCSTKAPSASLP
jgi:hypothetical protein